MITNELISYVKESLQNGHSQEDILGELKKAGWTEEVIAEAFAAASGTEAPKNTELLSTSALFSESFKKFKSVWLRYIFITLTPLLGILAFAIPVAFGFLVAFFVKSMAVKTVLVILGVISAIVAFVGFIYLTLVANVATLYSVLDRSSEKTFREIFKESRMLVGTVIWIGILYSLTAFAGFVALIIPGIILSILLMFGVFISLEENHKGLTALSVSWQYVSGRKAKVFWRMFVPQILYFIFVFVLGVFFALIKLPILSSIFSYIFALLYAPFITSYLYTLYKQLKATTLSPVDPALKVKKLKILSWAGLLAIPVFIAIVFTLLVTFIPKNNIIYEERPQNFKEEDKIEMKSLPYEMPQNSPKVKGLEIR